MLRNITDCCLYSPTWFLEELPHVQSGTLSDAGSQEE